MTANSDLAQALLRQANLTGTFHHIICARSGVSPNTLYRIQQKRSIPGLPTLIKLARGLGMVVTPDGELEWDNRITTHIAQPAAMREQLYVLRQNTYKFLKSCMPNFHGSARVLFLSEAVERGMITSAQMEELLAYHP